MSKRSKSAQFSQAYLQKVTKEQFLTDFKGFEANGYSKDDLVKVWQEAQPEKSKAESKKD